ncbi:MAG: hypothetical protein K6U10_14380 [Acidobacteriia bacterium]|nr:hypothetical protein [Methyloceanibacter sp.]MBX5471468.1 hypothetical protein [Acetobacteraceae bacterium]MCL6492989.1 hypothetical protein [Terriglobia bacterium]
MFQNFNPIFSDWVHTSSATFGTIVLKQHGPSFLSRFARRAILALDRALRCHYRIREFSANGACLLRIAPGVARKHVRLGDGTEIAPGDPILTLHFWNEHIPLYGEGRSGFAWAVQFRQMLDRSLTLLAAEMERNPELGAVRAVLAETAFVTRGRKAKLIRVALQFGFSAPVDPRGRFMEANRDLFRDILLFALGFAFNPQSLWGKPLRRERYELWLSRRALQARLTATEEGRQQTCRPKSTEVV